MAAADRGLAPLPQEALSEKLLSYETFLNDKLRVDLKKLMEKRERVYDESAEYSKLNTFLETLKDSQKRGAVKRELETQVDIGCNFFCEAVVPDTTHIMLHIGFGFHLEMGLDEAQAFIAKRSKLLHSRAELQTKQISELRALIRVVMEGIRDLQRIGNEPLPSDDANDRAF